VIADQEREDGTISAPSNTGSRSINRFINYISRHQPNFWWDYMQQHGADPNQGTTQNSAIHTGDPGKPHG
jgi:hypothetical protein